MLVNGPHPYVHMFESGIVPVTGKLRTEPVVQVRALWMDRNAKVTCDVADTDHKKRIGLQSYKSLAEDHGLYFPYPGCSDVKFHQGSVPFSLDLIFLRDGCVAGIKAHTVVGSKDLWGCNDCDGVIEVNSGYCDANEVTEGDRIIVCAYSASDIELYKKDRNAIAAELKSQLDNIEYRMRATSLMHGILGEDYYGK
jgi:uncharacterized membrane protein (UPF0127 family)